MAGTCCRRRTRKRGAPVRWPRRLNVGDANFGWYGALGHTSSTGVCMGDGRVCRPGGVPFSNRNGFCCLPWPPPGRCGRQTSDRGCGRRLAATSEPNSFSSFNTWMSTVAERWTPIRLRRARKPLCWHLCWKRKTPTPRPQVVRATAMLGVRVTRDEVLRLMLSVDVNRAGTLEAHEFVDLWATHMVATRPGEPSDRMHANILSRCWQR